jgi:hypothetical protein
MTSGRHRPMGWLRSRLVATGGAAKPLQAALSETDGIAPLDGIAFRGSTREIEVLGPEDRHMVTGAVASLMSEWPERFVEACRRQGAWSSAVLRDMESPPFAFWQPVMQDLYRPSYAPNDAEIAAAWAWLSKTRARVSLREVTRFLSTDSQARPKSRDS